MTQTVDCDFVIEVLGLYCGVFLQWSFLPLVFYCNPPVKKRVLSSTTKTLCREGQKMHLLFWNMLLVETNDSCFKAL